MTDTRERDILVASNEYAYVQDLTKGDIVLYVGPTKISLSNTERLVDYQQGRFVPVRADEGTAVATFTTATSSQYIVLENPAKDPNVKPTKGNNSAVELRVGRKVVVPGPASFPLWPGQRARIVDGHALREDEYLVVRVYDDGDESRAIGPIGTETIVRGEDTSFYVPVTGLEVVASPSGYVHTARRLRKGSGLHLRVVKSFTQTEGGAIPAGEYEAGQDIFIAEGEGFFFPTPNVEVVAEIGAIPLGERQGVYARDIATGRIQTIVGPVNYLPDPTRVQIVSRELDEDRADLYGIREADGHALAVYVPSSFAVLVTARSSREVVRGPQTRVLAFDEDLEVLELSTGKPKTQERTLRTCFLQVDGNKVSDVLRLKTGDHNEVEVSVSYRVSFVGVDETSWFNVKDYVALLCDHAGSLLRAAARACSIETFYQNGTEVLRTAILGEKHEGEPRPGRHFEENGMWIYDLEVLDMRILDPEVQVLLAGAQKNAIVAEVTRRQELLRLDTEKLKEQVRRTICEEQSTTMKTERERVEKKREVDLATAEAAAAVSGVADAARLLSKERENELERKMLDARVAAFRDQMSALAPELVATLKTLGHQQLAIELSKNASPLAILGGESVTDVVTRLLGALPLGADSNVKNVVKSVK